MDTTEAPPTAGRREWAGLGVLSLATMLTMLDINVLFLAIPKLSEDLGASSVQILWITDSYGFVIAGLLVTMGTLGDRIGRRRVLLYGAAAFGLASILAAFSSSPEMLIVSRALLGIGGATIMPSTLALIGNMFKDPRQFGTALSVWASALMAGVALGPVVGGVLLDAFWWGSVFLVALPVMVLLLATGPFLLPEHRDTEAGRLDLASVALSFATIVPVVYGLKELARDGLETVPIVVTLVGLVAGLVFVRRQRTLSSPLLDLRLFAIRAVAGGLVIAVFIGASQGGGGFLIAQHLQFVEGLTPLEAGLWMLVPVITMVFGIYLTPPLAKRIRPAYVLLLGMLLAAAGWVVLTQVDPAGGLATVIIGFTMILVGVSPMGVLVNQIVMQSAPPERMGSAASLQSTGGELGVAVGIAALGSMATAVYKNEVEIPSGVPAEAAAQASDNLAAAQGTISQLPTEIGARLLDSAHDAFTSGLVAVAALNAVVLVGLAVLSYATLRHIPPTGAEDTAEAPEESSKAQVAEPI